MEPEAHQDQFGSYLKGFRINQELAIETVANQTKIAVHCLKAIEENALERLPPQAYVKSFIRTYATAVGANADVAVELYLSDLKRRETAKQQKLKRRAKWWAVRRVIMAVAVIFSMLLLLRYSDLFLDSAPLQHTEVPQGMVQAEPAATGPLAASEGPSAVQRQDKLRLRIVAVERTWLKVIVDGQGARSYDLKPEDRLELEGANNFNLMIGNATGLQIFLNERPVKIFGSSDQVVSLKIP
jgi:cytoskeletal protein RodZ